ncbi:hypothetical protein H5410_061681 [Solanum commersonii]|uniref:Uncharacterized protein n=1 Tax=Solanum commersonii TaxID=4109 RepID=A0A9J5W8D6_SOLCO|nr:hypothetical protein H5410_061681 [Solanum commersonii]
MWCVDGQYQIYRDACKLNGNDRIAQFITKERQILTDILHTAPVIHDLFQRHKCEWMACRRGSYSEEIVREFYVSYVAIIRGSIFKRAKPVAHPLQKATLVRGFTVENSETALHRFIYGMD